jgi:hypothetical protein
VVPKRYRNTLRAHAYALASLGKAFADVAHEHRVAASAIERRSATRLNDDGRFAGWIAEACELSAAAERLLALEIELARKHGATWDDVASALGVSRQAAWERFGTHERWERSHRLSRLRQVDRSARFRRLAFGRSPEEVESLRRAFGMPQHFRPK